MICHELPSNSWLTHSRITCGVSVVVVALLFATTDSKQKNSPIENGEFARFLLSDHFKNDRLIIPVYLFQSGVLLGDLQEISMIEVRVNVTGVECGSDHL